MIGSFMVFSLIVYFFAILFPVRSNITLTVLFTES